MEKRKILLVVALIVVVGIVALVLLNSVRGALFSGNLSGMMAPQMVFDKSGRPRLVQP